MRKMKTRISLTKSEVNNLDQALLLMISHSEIFAKTCGTDITDEWYFKYLENFKRETNEWLSSKLNIMTKREVEFDDLWSIDQNLKYIEKEIMKIRKITKSIQIQEVHIDERILSAIYKNYTLLNKYL